MVAGFLGAQAPFPARDKGCVPLGTMVASRSVRRSCTARCEWFDSSVRDILFRARGTPYSEREEHLIPSERNTLFRARGTPYSEREEHLIPSEGLGGLGGKPPSSVAERRGIVRGEENHLL